MKKAFNFAKGLADSATNFVNSAKQTAQNVVNDLTGHNNNNHEINSPREMQVLIAQGVGANDNITIDSLSDPLKGWENQKAVGVTPLNAKYLKECYNDLWETFLKQASREEAMEYLNQGSELSMLDQNTVNSLVQNENFNLTKMLFSEGKYDILKNSIKGFPLEVLEFFVQFVKDKHYNESEGALYRKCIVENANYKNLSDATKQEFIKWVRAESSNEVEKLINVISGNNEDNIVENYSKTTGNEEVPMTGVSNPDHQVDVDSLYMSFIKY